MWFDSRRISAAVMRQLLEDNADEVYSSFSDESEQEISDHLESESSDEIADESENFLSIWRF